MISVRSAFRLKFRASDNISCCSAEHRWASSSAVWAFRLYWLSMTLRRVDGCGVPGSVNEART